MKKILTLCALAILLASCQQREIIHLHQWKKYFPNQLAQGKTIVYKYYHHFNFDGDKTRKTNIRYVTYEPEGDQIHINTYDAAFKQLFSETIQVEDNDWISISKNTRSYRVTDTNEYTIIDFDIHPSKNLYLSLKPSAAHYSYDWENKNHGVEIIQEEIRDTIINDRNCKLLSGIQKSFFPSGDEEQVTEYPWTKVFEEGLGMTRMITYTDDTNYELELAEIITGEEFLRRADHGMHRVAYIDPNKTLDDNPKFTTCNHISKIYDYYNGSSDGIQIEGSKGRLKAILQEKLDTDKIKGISGYYTFRFVINCKGEAGRFITEECGLDYQSTQFSEQSRQHLLSILMDIDEWIPLEIKGEKKDAYNYITFKIKDGEIIDLLP